MNVPPLQTVELGEFISTKLAQPLPILRNLLHEGTLAMAYGPAGAGKTFLMLSLAMGAAYGVEVLGWKPRARAEGKPASIPVAYVDGEMVSTTLQTRVNELVTPILAFIDHLWAPMQIVTPDFQPHGIPTDRHARRQVGCNKPGDGTRRTIASARQFELSDESRG